MGGAVDPQNQSKALDFDPTGRFERRTCFPLDSRASTSARVVERGGRPNAPRWSRCTTARTRRAPFQLAANSSSVGNRAAVPACERPKSSSLQLSDETGVSRFA